MPVVIRLNGVREAQQQLAGIRDSVSQSPSRVVSRSAQLLKAYLKVEAPRKSGKGARSIRYSRTKQGGVIMVKFFGSHRLGWVIGGTKAHDIWASVIKKKGAGGGKKALYWPGANHPSAHIHIPAQKPNDFRRRALADLRGSMNEVFQAEKPLILRKG